MRRLILGGSGMLGHKVWQRLSTGPADTYAVIRKRRTDYAIPAILDHPNIIEGTDLLDERRLRSLLGELKPDVVINCAGLTPRRYTGAHSTLMVKLNSLLPNLLEQWSESLGYRTIHFSTDCVFDGSAGNYTETSFRSADDLYGRTKALGEIAGPRSLTIRSSIIGRELGEGTELVEWFLAQSGRSVRGYRRAMFSGVTTLSMAGVVERLVVDFPMLTGLYQLASEPISKYDLLVLLREAFNVDVGVEPAYDVVLDRTLDGSLLRSTTGIVTPSWLEMVSALAADPTPYRGRR